MEKSERDEIIKHAARVVAYAGAEEFVTIFSDEKGGISVTYVICFSPEMNEGKLKHARHSLNITKEEWQAALIAAIVEGN